VLTSTLILFFNTERKPHWLVIYRVNMLLVILLMQVLPAMRPNLVIYIALRIIRECHDAVLIWEKMGGIECQLGEHILPVTIRFLLQCCKSKTSTTVTAFIALVSCSCGRDRVEIKLQTELFLTIKIRKIKDKEDQSRCL